MTNEGFPRGEQSIYDLTEAERLNRLQELSVDVAGRNLDELRKAVGMGETLTRNPVEPSEFMEPEPQHDGFNLEVGLMHPDGMAGLC